MSLVPKVVGEGPVLVQLFTGNSRLKQEKKGSEFRKGWKGAERRKNHNRKSNEGFLAQVSDGGI